MDAYETHLLETEEIADDTLSVKLEKPSGFDYESGQHIGVKIINPPETDADGNIRTLSLASAPHQDHLEIATRLKDSAFKQSLTEIEEGADFEIDGPYGSLTLHEDTGKPVVLIAGGIGITPFISMIRNETQIERDHDMTLFYSNRCPKDTTYLNELQKTAREHKNISVVPTMTRTDESDEWNGETGYITEEMISKYVDDTEGAVYYIAGPTDFVKAMEDLLEEMDVPELHIRAEIFSGYER